VTSGPHLAASHPGTRERACDADVRGWVSGPTRGNRKLAGRVKGKGNGLSGAFG
jgi:hypothetical protein